MSRSSYKRNDAKRNREDSSILKCIHKQIIDNCPHSILPVSFLIDQCTEDFNQQFPLKYTYMKDHASLTDEDEGNLLHLAVVKYSIAFVDLLMDGGKIDINSKTKKGHSLSHGPGIVFLHLGLGKQGNNDQSFP